MPRHVAPLSPIVTCRPVGHLIPGIIGLLQVLGSGGERGALAVLFMERPGGRHQATSIPPSTTTNWPVVNSLRIKNR
jgi:hypothetical protein